MSKLDPLEPVLMVSPHLDDAVLSCGNFLYMHPSTTVMTIFAGAPDAFHDGYNSRTTGKPYAPDAMRIRRDEDHNALALLDAIPVWLDLLDVDYAAYRPSTNYGDSIRSEIGRMLDEIRPKSVVAPLGLIHVDHLAVSEVCLQLAVDSPLTWFIYMDLPYGLGSRRALSKRIAAVSRTFKLVDVDSPVGDLQIKQRAMSLYASQYAVTRHNHRKAFDATMRGAERFWRLEPLRKVDDQLQAL